MQAQRKAAIHRLVLATGIALIALAVLLWWSGREAPDAHAAAREPQTVSQATWSDFGVAWASMTPTHTTVTHDGKVWEIAENGITITFFFNSLALGTTATFTFTPESGYELDPPLLGSYFFHLDGTLDWNPELPVSLNEPYSITLHYQESETAGAQEQSLSFYHYESLGEVWNAQASTVDTTQNVVECASLQIGLFGLGGYRYRHFIPLVMR